MNKTIFMQKLKSGLRHLPKADREDAILYYEEYFADMGVDENVDVTKELGQPEQIVKDIITDCTQKHIDGQDGTTDVKSSATTIWMVILAIFASPIAIPLALVIVSMLVCIIMLLLAFLVTIAAAGLTSVLFSFTAVCAIATAESIAQGILFAGMALVSFGIGVLVCIASWKLSVCAVRVVASICKNIFLRKKGKKEEI